MTKQDKVRQLIEKYLEIARKTGKQFSKRYLATVLYNENPEEFLSVENARAMVRSSLGCRAGGNRQKDKALAEAFMLLPEAVSDITTSDPFVFPVSIKKCLWIADVHSLFYNRAALEIACEYAIKQNCDAVAIDGDFFDFYGLSKFDKNPLTVNKMVEEREWGQDLLRLLQDTFGYVVLKQGNHDVRREKHIHSISAKIPELVEISSFNDYCFFDGCKVNFVEDYRHLVYGKLNAFHGHEYYGGGGIHVAYNRLKKAFDNIISAHSHISQSDIQKDINGNLYGSWTIGCMCGLNPRYAPKNNWTNGFAIVEKDASGEFEVNNRIILGNKTVNA